MLQLPLSLVLAAATSAAPAPVVEPPAPWVAVGLSAAAPLALGTTAAIVGPNNPSSLPWLVGLMPVGLSAGYIYAGDPGRGLAVTLGGYGAAGVGALVLTGLVMASPASGQGKGFAMGVAPIVGAGLGALAYSGWALFEVHGAAQRTRDTH